MNELLALARKSDDPSREKVASQYQTSEGRKNDIAGHVMSLLSALSKFYQQHRETNKMLLSPHYPQKGTCNKQPMRKLCFASKAL